MERHELLRRIRGGRTDLVFELLRLPNWRDALREGPINALQWFVYYGDVTAMRAVTEAGGDLGAIELGPELGNAAFCGHWKMCDFLLAHGADVEHAQHDTGETALHGALAKAGRPYYLHVLRVLLENGADVHAATKPGVETGAFMRDVRTVGETALHRAAAYGDEAMIRLLLEHGADKEARDAHGDSPLSWASRHLRPGSILSLLAFGEHRIGAGHVEQITSDHGSGWGNGMERKLIGEFLPESPKASRA
jgi:ankyrin repeat protein